MASARRRCVVQRSTVRTIVTADGDGATDSLLVEQGAEGAADQLGGFDGEILPHDAANVVLTEDAWRDHE
jgi:hypothetical protein